MIMPSAASSKYNAYLISDLLERHFVVAFNTAVITNVADIYDLTTESCSEG